MTFSADKSALRQHLLEARRTAAHAQPDAGQAVADAFPVNDELPPRSCIAGYWPLEGEIDPRPLMFRLHAAGHQLCLPVVLGPSQPLIFRAWSPGDPLERGGMGVHEPAPDQPVMTPNLVIVPLLGFDPAGNRIGFGKGYYDRTLAVLRRAGPVRAIGLAFECQRVAQLPVEGHDQPLDGVMTERGLSTFSAPPSEAD